MSLGTITWKKTNGNIMETNDAKATVEYCESMGWEQIEAIPAETEEERAARVAAQEERARIEKEAEMEAIRESAKAEAKAEILAEMKAEKKTESNTNSNGSE